MNKSLIIRFCTSLLLLSSVYQSVIEIKKKYILNHEYKSIVDDSAKLQKEKKYKQQNKIIRKLIKK